jgi:hypothetical protein
MFFALVKSLVANILGSFSSLLWTGGFFSWYRINLLWQSLFFFSLVSATSSYVDDIAHT